MISELREWSRAQLYGVRQGGWRANATIAVAASAARETYRLTDDLPDLQNDTSDHWRITLERVWDLLGGDARAHYDLSRAIADYLAGPLNHIDGQDGPDDFDRPQTIAAYSAALAAVAWGVDFAVTAVGQIFEAIDIKYDGAHNRSERWIEIQREADFARRVIRTVVGAELGRRSGLDPAVLEAIRS